MVLTKFRINATVTVKVNNHVKRMQLHFTVTEHPEHLSSSKAIIREGFSDSLVSR